MEVRRPPEVDAFEALRRHREEVGPRHLRELFRDDPARGRRYACEAAGIHLDYSKNRITDETLRRLCDLARGMGLRERIEAMFRGERINETEGRPVLHVALRAPRSERILVDGRDVVAEVHAVRERMEAFAGAFRAGELRGHAGRRLRNLVHIGIGGSELGPRMVYEALRPQARDDLRIRFVANLDAFDFAEAVRGLDPDETLFLVCSKTFTTLETLTNARTAREWLRARRPEPEAVARHFAAVSGHRAEAERFGIPPERIFEMWDFVGGRFSVDSAIGLSVLVAVGPAAWAEFLAGLRAMDEHFREAPFERNLPVLLALLSIWYSVFFGAETRAVLPYAQALARFPAFLQQLEMESDGKGVDRAGRPVTWPTAPVVFGEPGTNGQHAFFQLLHQGTHLVPCDFIVPCRSPHPLGVHQDLLVANCLAQTEALAFGRTAEEVAAEGVPPELVPHRTFPGNRPSNTLMIDDLSPRSLGALVALYEHRVMAEGTILAINSFDQWGVELGKRLAGALAEEIRTGRPGSHDSSTTALLTRYLARRQPPSGPGGQGGPPLREGPGTGRPPPGS